MSAPEGGDEPVPEASWLMKVKETLQRVPVAFGGDKEAVRSWVEETITDLDKGTLAKLWEAHGKSAFERSYKELEVDIREKTIPQNGPRSVKSEFTNIIDSTCLVGKLDRGDGKALRYCLLCFPEEDFPPGSVSDWPQQPRDSGPGTGPCRCQGKTSAQNMKTDMWRDYKTHIFRRSDLLGNEDEDDTVDAQAERKINVVRVMVRAVRLRSMVQSIVDDLKRNDPARMYAALGVVPRAARKRLNLSPFTGSDAAERLQFAQKLAATATVEFIAQNKLPLTLFDKLRDYNLRFLRIALDDKSANMVARGVGDRRWGADQLKKGCQQVLSRLKEILPKQEAVAISLDGWTTSQARHACALHFWWIDENLKLRRALGGFVAVDGQADAARMRTVIEEVCDRVHVKRVIAVTADGGSELPVAVGLLDVPYYIHCHAHQAAIILKVSHSVSSGLLFHNLTYIRSMHGTRHLFARRTLKQYSTCTLG